MFKRFKIKDYFSNEIINCTTNFSLIKDTDFKYYSKYSNISFNCSKCINDYNSDINCYKYLEGYYLDNSVYKLCYSTCKKCDREGNETNHNCIECNSNNKFEMPISNYLNCYNKCENYYYIDIITNKTYCTRDLNCPQEYSKLILKKRECINDCNKDNIYKYEYNGTCYDKEQLKQEAGFEEIKE